MVRPAVTTIEPAQTHGSRQKKAKRLSLAFSGVWWSWRELNPRPQAIFVQFYMCSRLI